MRFGKSDLQKLKSIRSHLALERFDCDGVQGGTVIDERTGETVKPTDYVRSHIRLYLDTWVLPHLNQIISKEEARLGRQARK